MSVIGYTKAGADAQFAKKDLSNSEAVNAINSRVAAYVYVNAVVSGGCIGNGTTDDTAAFAALVNPGSGVFQHVHIPAGKTIRITSQVLWDVYKTRLTGGPGSAIFLDIANTATWGIKAFSTSPAPSGSPVYNKVNRHGGITIYAASHSCNGLQLKGTTSAAHTTFRDFVFRALNIGLDVADNTYMTAFKDCTFNDCNTFVQQVVANNNGERITFDNCDFASPNTPGGLYAISNTVPQTMQFKNCSFDWASRMFHNSGIMTFTQCHVETPSSAMLTAPTSSDNFGLTDSTGFTVFSECRFNLNQGTPVTLAWLFYVSTADSVLDFDRCHFNVAGTTALGAGPGRVRVEKCKIFNGFSACPAVTSLTQKHNRLADGVLANATLIDAWTTTSGASGAGTLVTSPLYGTNTHTVKQVHQFAGVDDVLRVTVPVSSELMVFSFRAQVAKDGSAGVGQIDYRSFEFLNDAGNVVGTMTDVSPFSLSTSYSLLTYQQYTEQYSWWGPSISKVRIGLHNASSGNNTIFYVGDAYVGGY